MTSIIGPVVQDVAARHTRITPQAVFVRYTVSDIMRCSLASFCSMICEPPTDKCRVRRGARALMQIDDDV